MKQYKLLPILTILATTVLSCDKEENNSQEENIVGSAYIINEGAFGQSNGSIDRYSEKNKSITKEVYKTTNGIAIGALVQSMAIFKDIAYSICNSADKIDIMDATTLMAIRNPIKTNITNPRYLVSSGENAYISCLGKVPLLEDWNTIPNGYIAKMDLTNFSVIQIPLPGGAEGLFITSDKLYIAQYAKPKIAVMNLSSEKMTYINVPSNPEHIIRDSKGKLLVTAISSALSPDSVGVVVIDPITDSREKFIPIPNLSGKIQLSNDEKALYILQKEAWPGTKSFVCRVDMVSGSIKDTVIRGENFTGFAMHPNTEELYILIAPSYTELGTLKIYSKQGELRETHTTGIGPKDVIFY